MSSGTLLALKVALIESSVGTEPSIIQIFFRHEGMLEFACPITDLSYSYISSDFLYRPVLRRFGSLYLGEGTTRMENVVFQKTSGLGYFVIRKMGSLSVVLILFSYK